jgi:hypothetical protein
MTAPKENPMPHEIQKQTALTGPQTEVSALVKLAVEKDLDVEKLEKLFALYERDQKRLAEQEFFKSLAEFQAVCPPIRKSTEKAASRDGGPSYNYAELDEIVRTVQPILHGLGFSYTWDMPKPPENGLIECLCKLRHVKGHEVVARFVCPFASKAGMSEQQKYASALTYARRYSLIQVLGLSTTEKDTDGIYEEPHRPVQNARPAENGGGVSLDGYVSLDQVSEIEQKLHEAGRKESHLLTWLSGRAGRPIKKLSDIPRDFYGDAIRKLDATIAENAKKASGVAP